MNQDNKTRLEKCFHSVFSDLDNTLLMPDKSLSPKTREILSHISRDGVNVIPSTGRAFWSMPKEVIDFPAFSYVIVSNGAAIYDMRTKKPIISLTLDKDVVVNILQFLKDRGEYVTYECFVEGQGYTSQSYFNDPAEFGIPGDREKNYVQSTRVPVDDIEKFVLEHANELDALDVIVLPPERNRISTAIEETFDGIYVTTSVEHLIEISNAKSGKHQAMKALMDHLGLSMDGTMAFGDGNNDYEMLAHAGRGVAVLGASEICKAHADVVIGHSHEESVANYLETIFCNKMK